VKDIFALRLYTRVARLGNFSAAARECGLSQSQASRIVADLEADLGARLLTRSTRAVIPRLAAFTAMHPNLRIHFLLEDRRQRYLVRGPLSAAQSR